MQFNIIQIYQEMISKKHNQQLNIDHSVQSQHKNKSSFSSLNKYGKSPYLQKISQGFTLPKKNLNTLASLKDKEDTSSKKDQHYNKYREPKLDKMNNQRSRSNMSIQNDRGSPRFRLPKIDVEDTKTDKKQKQKLSTNSLSATLDATSKKRRLLPLQNIFRRQTVHRTKAGTNGKQTKINQDIAIVQTNLPYGVKLYCVCDGHGLNGHIVSAFIKQNLIKNLISTLKKFTPESHNIQDVFEEVLAHTNEALLNSDINTELSGSTVIAVFIYKQMIYSFNVGDSRAIIASHQKQEWKMIPLSDDQKPSRQDEKQRILQFGGRIEAQKNQRGEESGPLRVWMKDIQMPGLAMTRSFGDKAGRKAGTNGDPEIITHKIKNLDKFMVIASDGVWQYLQSDQVMNIIIPFFIKNDIDLAAQKIVRISSQIWHKLSYSRDDITIIIISLNPMGSQDSEQKSDTKEISN